MEHIRFFDYNGINELRKRVIRELLQISTVRGGYMRNVGVARNGRKGTLTRGSEETVNRSPDTSAAETLANRYLGFEVSRGRLGSEGRGIPQRSCTRLLRATRVLRAVPAWIRQFIAVTLFTRF